jgi:hypothetical protein
MQALDSTVVKELRKYNTLPIPEEWRKFLGPWLDLGSPLNFHVRLSVCLLRWLAVVVCLPLCLPILEEWRKFLGPWLDLGTNICLSICPSACLNVCLVVCLSSCLYVCLSSYRLPIAEEW